MPEKRGRRYSLVVTTQGPLYPPAEVVDSEGNFVVIGQIPRAEGIYWGAAIVDKNSPLPPYNQVQPYHIRQELDSLPEKNWRILCCTPCRYHCR